MGESKFTTLLDEYSGLLSRIAISYEADPSLRDDLLQDMALALWQAVPTWRGEASMKTFVARVAHHRGASHVISRKRHPRTIALGRKTPGRLAAFPVCVDRQQLG